MKRYRNSRGETLVETIVSFLVVLLTLVMITTVVQLCIRLNNRAMDKAKALETATDAIEQSVNIPAAKSGAMTLTMPDGDSFTIPYNLYSGDLLTYFTPIP